MKGEIMTYKTRRVAGGLLAGLAGGLIATWTMGQFQNAWSKAAEKLQDEPKPQNDSGEDADDATMKAADKVSRNLLHRPLTQEQKKKASPFVSYAFGGTMGALYGVAAELLPAVTRGFGTGFGAAVWAAADEIAVPAFGLAEGPTKAPISSHLLGLASHLVYGSAAEGVRRLALLAI